MMKKNVLRFGFLVALLVGAGSVNVFAATYYSQGSVAPNTQANWNTNRGGDGSSPANFTSGDVFVIQNGHNMTTSNTWSVSGSGSRVWIESGGTLTASHNITLALATTFQIDNSGSYVQNVASSMGSNVLQGTEIFGASSNFTYNFVPTGASAPSAPGYGNLTINTTTGSGNFGWGGTITQVQGDLTITSTGTGSFRHALTAGSNISVSIGGNLTINGSTALFWLSSGAGTCAITVGGTFSISAGTFDLANSSGAGTLNLGGNFSQTGGTFLSNSATSTVNFTGGSSSDVTFSTSGGTFTNTNLNWQIASGKTVANNTNFGAGSWLASSRTMTVNGTFQINQGSWTGSLGTWSYGAGASLIFNNTSGSYGPIDNGHIYWPSSNGPTNVNVLGAGGITLSVARTVSGTFQTSAGVTNGNNLTLNGTAQINAGGFFTGSPTYGGSSTLVYNTGATYGRGAEWSATSGAGYPNNVTINSGSSLDLGANSGSGTARQMAGNLTVEGGLFMDFGANDMTQPLTVLGNVAIGNSGNLSLSDASGGDLYVRGNWSRTGGGAFNPKNRAVFFTGTSGDQTITGATTFDFLILDKAAGNLLLSNDATVNQTLTLTNGRLTLGNNNLTVSGSISGASSTRYIETNGTGKLIRSVGTSPVIYPVGNSSYNPATLTRTAASNSFGVRVIDAVYDGGTGGTPITDDVVNRTWDVTLEGSSVGSLTIQVQWGTSDQGNGFNGSACYLSHYTGGGWLQTTEAAAGGGNPYTISRSGITSLSPFAVGSKGALPIELLSFTAKSLFTSIRLDWRTASEQNNDYMAVERSSDGSRWEELGRVTGAGTTTLPQSYHFTDEKPLPGLNYYRLRQVDYDGRFEYHKTIAVDFKTERGGLHLFPSPAQERLNVALPAPAEQESELWLLDVQGRILQRMVIPQGGTQGAFEVAALPEGVYFVRMSAGDVRSFRFVR